MPTCTCDTCQQSTCSACSEAFERGSNGAEWDWPNIDKGYDRLDDEGDDPEWCRNIYRGDARAALIAAIPLLREHWNV